MERGSGADGWSTSQRCKSFQAPPQYFVAGKTAEVKPDDGAAGQGQRAGRWKAGTASDPKTGEAFRHPLHLSVRPVGAGDRDRHSLAWRSIIFRCIVDTLPLFLPTRCLTDSLASSRQGERE